MAVPALSVVIAARDEAARLPALLAQLAAAPALIREVLVVDGGSRDATAQAARLAGATLVRCDPGRGLQYAAGAALAVAPWLLLLHADARLPPGWAGRLSAVIAAADRRPTAWYFELAIADPAPALRLVELAVRLRSRWRQRPYGDQGLLLPQALYRAVGGMRPLPLMEDLDLVERLGRRARLRSLGLALRVDGRRWRSRGVWQTTLANWRLRRDWHRGVSAAVLARRYYAAPAAQGAYQKAQRRSCGSRSQPWA
ncbi:MAG: TIGR04283 family arsenosugar biosynthesis glycosyltransferase [Cyanobium sp.]|nr:TIGR04283 family arsenosugar biosynthesis glycosyltransferase [Cyanobium sp.]